MGILSSILGALPGRRRPRPRQQPPLPPVPRTASSMPAGTPLDSTSCSLMESSMESAPSLKESSLVSRSSPRTMTAEEPSCAVTSASQVATATLTSTGLPSSFPSSSSSSSVEPALWMLSASTTTSAITTTTTTTSTTVTASTLTGSSTEVATTAFSNPPTLALSTVSYGSAMSALARPHKRRMESESAIGTGHLILETTGSGSAYGMAMEIDSDTTVANINQKRPNPMEAASITAEDNRDQELKVMNRMFDVPEIIRSIAEFLDKPSLAATCRVSRIWARHCTPLLWKHIVDRNWRHGYFCGSIKEHAPYVRSMKCDDWTDYEEVLLCDFSRLVGLNFHGRKEAMTVKVRILEKVARTLKALGLSALGEDVSAEMARALKGLQGLRTLRVSGMGMQAKDLEGVMEACLELEFLSLSRVEVDVESDAEIQKRLLGLDKDKVVRTGVKYLALKDVYLPGPYLIHLIRKCPLLLEFSLARNEQIELTLETVAVLKGSCPRLYALDVSSCKSVEHEIFESLFTSLNHTLTVLNLSGTRVEDSALLILAENCKGLTRLDIQYCTAITTMGLHCFLGTVGVGFRHLEASGVTIEPFANEGQVLWGEKDEAMVKDGEINTWGPWATTTPAPGDSSLLEGTEPGSAASGSRHGKNRNIPPAWTCSNLQILFVHIGLFGKVPPKPTVVTPPPVFCWRSPTPPLGILEMEQVKLPPETEDDILMDATPTTPSTTNTTTTINLPSEQNHDPASPPPPPPPPPSQTQYHPLHPTQHITDLQYLGLMGYGTRLTALTTNGLLSGFRSVKRLNILGLNQTFTREDLEWLAGSLPELCRIDAERYNVADEVLAWFHDRFPDIRIHRHE